MNIQVSRRTLEAGAAAHYPLRKKRFCSRVSLLDEIVAGFLWMHLDLPEDVTRDEIESFARHVIVRINFGADEAAVERELAMFQFNQFCRPVKRDIVRALARRSIAAVTSY